MVELYLLIVIGSFVFEKKVLMICFPMPLTFCKLSENKERQTKNKNRKKVHMHIYMHAWYPDTKRKKAEINHI